MRNEEDFRYNTMYDNLRVHLTGRKTALDVGCGLGSLSRWMAREGLEVIGLDCSANQIETCKQKDNDEGTSVRYLIYDLNDLQYQTGLKEKSFDVVTCHNVLAFLKQPKELLRRISGQWLNQGGVLNLVVENPQSQRIVNAFAGRYFTDDDLHRFSQYPEQLRGIYPDIPPTPLQTSIDTRYLQPYDVVTQWLLDSGFIIVERKGLHVLAGYLNQSKHLSESSVKALEDLLACDPSFFEVAFYNQFSCVKYGDLVENL